MATERIHGCRHVETVAGAEASRSRLDRRHRARQGSGGTGRAIEPAGRRSNGRVRRENLSDPKVPMLGGLRRSEEIYLLAQYRRLLHRQRRRPHLRLAREAGGWNLVKLGGPRDRRLFSTRICRGTFEAARTHQGGVRGDGPTAPTTRLAARRLQEMGSSRSCRWARSIGSGLGIQNPR